MLRYCLLGLGIGAAALALPVGLDGRWCALSWSLQGAMIVYATGAGQRPPPCWRLALALQAGAWGLFLSATGGLEAQAALQAGLWLGFLVLAATSLQLALVLRGGAGDARRDARHYALLSTLLLAIATLWLLAGAWTEIVLRTQGLLQNWLLAGSALAGAVMLRVLARRLHWPAAADTALALQGIAGVALLALAPWDAIARDLFASLH